MSNLEFFENIYFEHSAATLAEKQIICENTSLKKLHSRLLKSIFACSIQNTKKRNYNNRRLKNELQPISHTLAKRTWRQHVGRTHTNLRNCRERPRQQVRCRSAIALQQQVHSIENHQSIYLCLI